MKIKGTVEEGLYTELMDAEGDEFIVNFDFDGCATIKTRELTYLKLTSEMLNDLAYTTYIADKKYNNEL